MLALHNCLIPFSPPLSRAWKIGSCEITPSTSSTREEDDEKLNQFKNTLIQQWFNGEPLYLYQNFWAQRLDNIISCQNHFQAQDTDIIITSIRKAGTTWLKALLFSIINRTNYPPPNNPLLTHNPHELVPQFETNNYAKSKCPSYLNTLKPPRLFGTHIPFPPLPNSIKTSNCKIIYICRNPFDTLVWVSSWLFYLNLDDNKSLKPNMLGQYFDMFCERKIPFGPFEDHVLGYWKQSIENPHKVLFIKYEDLKGTTKNEVKRMAEFVG